MLLKCHQISLRGPLRRIVPCLQIVEEQQALPLMRQRSLVSRWLFRVTCEH